MANEKIQEKIKKLLALSSSPNEAEAALAMEKAHELLKTYNLSLSQISINEEDDAGIIEETYMESNRLHSWKLRLAAAVCSANYCKAYRLKSFAGYSDTGLRAKSSVKIQIVGKEHNVAVAKEMMNYLISAVQRMSWKFPGSESNSYRIGLTDTLCKRLREMIEKEKESDSTANALMVVETAKIDEYLRRLNLVSLRLNNNVASSRARMLGQTDGHKISLHNQINYRGSNSSVAGYLQ